MCPLMKDSLGCRDVYPLMKDSLGFRDVPLNEGLFRA